MAVCLTRDDIARVLSRLPFATTDPDRVEITEAFLPIAGGTAGLCRASADGRSCVVKVLHCADGGDHRWRPGRDEDHWYYWRREALVYESGLLTELRPPLRAPEVFAVAPAGESGIAIWMEDIPGTLAARSRDRAAYLELAFRLGQAQARYTAQPPDAPWLSRRWLRHYLGLRDAEGGWLEDTAAWRALGQASGLSPGLAPAFRRLWDQRYEYVSRLERAPQTLSHFDMHLKNVMVGAGDCFVLIDWAFAGIGAVGEDVGNLHPNCVLDFYAPAADLWPMFEQIAEAFHSGLRAAGLTLDRAGVRWAMAAATTAKYAWIVPAMLMVAASDRPALNGKPTAEAMPVWAETAEFLLRLERDVLRLPA